MVHSLTVEVVLEAADESGVEGVECPLLEINTGDELLTAAPLAIHSATWALF